MPSRIPNYLTPDQFAKRYALVPRNAGNALAQALNNGGVISQNNIIVAAAVAAALAVRAKSQISRSLRALEQARGQVVLLQEECMKTLSILSQAHVELVTASRKVESTHDDLNSFNSFDSFRTEYNALDKETKERIMAIWKTISMADLLAHREAS